MIPYILLFLAGLAIGVTFNPNVPVFVKFVSDWYEYRYYQGYSDGYKNGRAVIRFVARIHK